MRTKHSIISLLYLMLPHLMNIEDVVVIVAFNLILLYKKLFMWFPHDMYFALHYLWNFILRFYFTPKKSSNLD